MSLLRVEDLSVRYGGIEAVRHLSFEVVAGARVCLIGANGAGKTSTLKAICGLAAKATGRVLLADEDISALPTQDIAARGLALVPEGRGVFKRMTVLENLEMGAYLRGPRAAWQADLDHAYALFPRLAERRAQAAGTLSGGEQQMLAIARALMSRPRLLLLDEPGMGLAPVMISRIYAALGQIARDGPALLLVEQNARLALRFCEQGHVLESGERTLSGPAAQLLHDPAVQQAYLG
jgi:branched-chain amino acid transport system ATP-binding protein